MVIGVIDIGTNTTRLLVAEVGQGGLRPLLQRRDFLGGERNGAPTGRLAQLVSTQADLARRHGAREIVVAGTAGLRGSTPLGPLEQACERAGTGPLRVLSEREEAELAFLGATRGAGAPKGGWVVVVDVGGGSTELAAGPAAGGVEWWTSRPLGSRTLTAAELASDPPATAEVEAAVSRVAEMLAGLEPPRFDTALAVGGGHASLRRLCGARIDRDASRAALGTLLSAGSTDVAERLGLAEQRIRLMPAALLILDAVADLLGRPLTIAEGGIREGLALRRAEQLEREPSWRAEL